MPGDCPAFGVVDLLENRVKSRLFVVLTLSSVFALVLLAVAVKNAHALAVVERDGGLSFPRNRSLLTPTDALEMAQDIPVWYPEVLSGSALPFALAVKVRSSNKLVGASVVSSANLNHRLILGLKATSFQEVSTVREGGLAHFKSIEIPEVPSGKYCVLFHTLTSSKSTRSADFEIVNPVWLVQLQVSRSSSEVTCFARNRTDDQMIDMPATLSLSLVKTATASANETETTLIEKQVLTGVKEEINPPTEEGNYRFRCLVKGVQSDSKEGTFVVSAGHVVQNSSSIMPFIDIDVSSWSVWQLMYTSFGITVPMLYLNGSEFRFSRKPVIICLWLFCIAVQVLVIFIGMQTALHSMAQHAALSLLAAFMFASCAVAFCYVVAQECYTMGRIYSIFDTLHVLPTWISFTLWQQRTGFWNHTRLLLGFNDILPRSTTQSDDYSPKPYLAASLRSNMTAEVCSSDLPHTITFSDDLKDSIRNGIRFSDSISEDERLTLTSLSAYGRSTFTTPALQSGDSAKCYLVVRKGSVVVSVSVDAEGVGSSQLLSEEFAAQNEPHCVVHFVASGLCRLSLRVSALTVKGADVRWEMNTMCRSERTCFDRTEHHCRSVAFRGQAQFATCCRVLYRWSYFVLAAILTDNDFAHSHEDDRSRKSKRSQYHRHYQLPNRLLLAISLSIVLLFALVVYSLKLAHFVTDGIIDTSVLVLLEGFSTLHNYVELHVIGWMESTAGALNNATVVMDTISSSHGQLHNLIAALSYWNSLFPASDEVLAIAQSVGHASSNTFGSTRELITQLRDLTHMFNRTITEESVSALKDSINTSNFAACIISCLVTIINLVLTAKVYEKRLFQMRRGRYFMDYQSRQTATRKWSRACAPNFVGLQIVHVGLSFCGLMSIMWTVLFWLLWSPGRSVLAALFTSLLLRIITVYLALRLVTLVIFKRCILSTTNSGVGVIRHRRLFELFDFIFIVYGIVGSILTAVIRFCITFFLYMSNIARIDRTAFPRDTEVLDAAYASYNAMALLDHEQNNPVVRVCCRMLEQQQALDVQVFCIDGVAFEWTPPKLTSRGRPFYAMSLRWWLLVTLHRNPELRKYRKHQIAVVQRRGYLLMQAQDDVNAWEKVYVELLGQRLSLFKMSSSSGEHAVSSKQWLHQLALGSTFDKRLHADLHATVDRVMIETPYEPLCDLVPNVASGVWQQEHQAVFMVSHIGKPVAVGTDGTICFQGEQHSVDWADQPKISRTTITLTITQADGVRRGHVVLSDGSCFLNPRWEMETEVKQLWDLMASKGLPLYPKRNCRGPEIGHISIRSAQLIDCSDLSSCRNTFVIRSPTTTCAALSDVTFQAADEKDKSCWLTKLRQQLT